jgi:hypothetical protein
MPDRPAREEAGFFRHLDADVDRLGLPVKILLTAPWHRRSTDELAVRYGASIEATLTELTALPVERLLVSHGEAVLERARERMAEAVALARG